MDWGFRDLRHAIRRLRRRPVFTLTSVLTLGLGLGGVVSTFALVHHTLLAPLGYDHEERLVRLWKLDPERDFDHYPVLFPELDAWRRSAKSFESLGAVTNEGTWTLTLATERDPEVVQVAPVSWEHFQTLGIEVAHGRAFEASDETRGEPYPVVISHRAWIRRFASDPALLGRLLEIHGEAHEVVGIAGPDLAYPQEAELWRCLAAGTRAELEGLGRLRPGVSLEQARQEIEALSRSFHESSPDFLQGKVVVARTLHETLVGEARRPLLLFLGAAGLFLLLAWANVANLVMLDAAGRRRPLAVRAALGATRGRMITELFTESALLAVAGGGFGFLLAEVGLRALETLRPEALPRLEVLPLGPEAWAVGLGATVLTGLLGGLAGASEASRSSAFESLRAARGQGPRARGWMRALVVGQLAGSLVLLVGSGLLLRTFAEHRGLDRGFETSQLLSAELRMPARLRGTAEVRRLHRELLPSLEGIPGVRSVAAVLNRPLAQQDGYDALIQVEGQSESEARLNPWVNLEVASSAYLKTLGAPLLRGRFVSDEDREDSQPVVVINHRLARRHWPGGEVPGEEAVGKRLRLLGPDQSWLTVVGVIGDLRYRHLTEVRDDLIFPLSQSPWAPLRLMIRTDGEAAAVAPAVRQEIQRWAPEAAVGVSPVAAVLDEELAPQKLRGLVAAVLACLALALSTVGVYGVMASLAGTRRHEVGVRMALGADRGQILRLVLGQGLSLTLPALVLGLGGAVLTSRLLASLLFQVSTLDPWTYLLQSALLLTIATAATWIPARKAAHQDPLEVLRGTD
jgi:putative ABC transport system permease protein